MQGKSTHTYVAFTECGCAIGFCGDNPDRASDVARDVARWVRLGCAVELLPFEPADLEYLTCRGWHGVPPRCPHPGACPERERYEAMKAAPAQEA